MELGTDSESMITNILNENVKVQKSEADKRHKIAAITKSLATV
jgi:hypothetical protein